MVSIGAQSDRSSSTSNQNVWGEQSPYLTDLYGRGSDLMQSQSNISDYSTNFTNQNMPTANNMVTDMSNLDSINAIRNGNNLGMQTMADQMNPQSNPYLEQSINNMKSGMADNMNIFGMSDNRSEAQMAGQFGGTRHGVDDYLTRKEVMNQATDAELNMRNSNYQADMNRANQAATGYVSAGMNANSQLVNQGGATIDAINATHNLGLNPYQASWMPLSNQAQLVGGPTTLATSTSSGRGSGFNAGVGN